MTRRVVQHEDGTYGLIEDSPNISISIDGAIDIVEIDDDQTWDDLRKTDGDHDKVKEIIGESIE